MLVITTIYCAELGTADEPVSEMTEEKGVLDLGDAGRELLSIYQGQNRVLPTDLEW